MKPSALRYRRAEHRAPGRLVIAWTRARRAAADRYAIFSASTSAAWDICVNWIAGFAFALAILLAHAWLARADAEAELRTAKLAAIEANDQAIHLQDQLAQVRALGNCQTLFYLVEARTHREVFQKLTQAATQLDAARSAEWTPATR